MRTDKFGNIIYNENDLLELVYQDKQNLLEQVICESNIKLNGLNLKHINEDFYNIDIEDFDAICQNEWLMPDEYKTFDIETWLYNQITPWDDNNQRLRDELFEFEVRGMMDLLRWMKYFVDTARANNIVWGVGRIS